MNNLSKSLKLPEKSDISFSSWKDASIFVENKLKRNGASKIGSKWNDFYDFCNGNIDLERWNNSSAYKLNLENIALVLSNWRVHEGENPILENLLINATKFRSEESEKAKAYFDITSILVNKLAENYILNISNKFRIDKEELTDAANSKVQEFFNRNKFEFERVAGFKSYIKLIINNAAVDITRQNKKMPKDSLDDNLKNSENGTTYVDLLKSDFESADSTFDKADYGVNKLWDILENSNFKIAEEQLKVLKMRLIDELTFKDISEQLDISINTALGRFRYALINIRKNIPELYMVYQSEIGDLSNKEREYVQETGKPIGDRVINISVSGARKDRSNQL